MSPAASHGAAGSGPPPPPPPAASWHVAQAGQTLGPFSIEQLSQAVAAGQLTRSSLVWTAGMAGWLAAETVPALVPLFAPQPPPPPVDGSR